MWNTSTIDGYEVEARDGPLGTVSDLLFDQANWMVRWLVVDTDRWLSSRKVLLPPSALGNIDPARRQFSVKLTVQQVKDSPDIDTDRPVSRQMETNTYDHYNCAPYCGNVEFSNSDGYVGGIAVSPAREESIADGPPDDDDQHLRSVEAVSGYHIHAGDGEIGHIECFLLRDADWSINFLVVDTKNWWPGRKVLISPRSAVQIDWTAKLVTLNVDRQRVKDSPAYHATAAVDRLYEKHFNSHYGLSDAQAIASAQLGLAQQF